MRPLLQAEQAVLGAVLLDPDQLDQLDWLQPDHFYRPAHQALFAALRHLRSQGQPALGGDGAVPLACSSCWPRSPSSRPAWTRSSAGFGRKTSPHPPTTGSAAASVRSTTAANPSPRHAAVGSPTPRAPGRRHRHRRRDHRHLPGHRPRQRAVARRSGRPRSTAPDRRRQRPHHPRPGRHRRPGPGSTHQPGFRCPHRPGRYSPTLDHRDRPAGTASGPQPSRRRASPRSPPALPDGFRCTTQTGCTTHPLSRT
jgi:hypothetical protein